MAVLIMRGVKVTLDVLPDMGRLLGGSRRLVMKKLLQFADDALPDSIKKLTAEVRFTYEPVLEVTVIVPFDTDMNTLTKLRDQTKASIQKMVDAWEREES